HDRRALGQHLPVLELERRDIALGVDLVIVLARPDRLLLEVDPVQAEGKSGLEKRDMRRHRAGPGRVEELHAYLLASAATAPSAMPRALHAAPRRWHGAFHWTSTYLMVSNSHGQLASQPLQG